MKAELTICVTLFILLVFPAVVNGQFKEFINDPLNSKDLPATEDWYNTYYYTVFNRYYYGYYEGYGASEISARIGINGSGFEVSSWLKKKYGAELGFFWKRKGGFEVSPQFLWAFSARLQASLGPSLRFIPETLEEPRKIRPGFEADVGYYYWPDVGFKFGYNTSTSFNLGVMVRINNIVFRKLKI